jgi:hypothetical protein
LAILGISFQTEWVQLLLGQVASQAPSVAGVLLATLFSIFAGMVASTIRWLIVDSIHHCFGLSNLGWSFSNLERRFDGFQVLLESHYRYYQFYGNCVVTMPILFIGRWSKFGFAWMELLLLLCAMMLFMVASHDALSKYYQRTASLMRQE